MKTTYNNKTQIISSVSKFPNTLAALEEYIAALIAEHGGDAQVKFNAEDEDGNDNDIDCIITRAATQAEIDEKLTASKAQEDYFREQRRKDYDRLRAEFETK